MPTVTETFAGASIRAYERGTRVVIEIILPSGRKIFNADGWSANEWDSQLSDANPADIAALTSLKGSWLTIQADLRQQVTAPPPEPPVVTKPEPPKEDPVAKQAETSAPPAVNTNPTTDTPVVAEQPRPADNLVNDDNPASVNAAGQNVGLAVRDETGAVSNLRRNPETGKLYDPGNIPAYQAATANANVGSAFNNNTRRQIIPRPNVLDNFSSYTYQASVYLMSPTQYTSFIRTRKKTLNGYYLLFQSGGAPNNVGGFQGALSDKISSTRADLESEGIGLDPNVAVPSALGDTTSGRNPAFPLDFYIDSVTVVNAISGQGSGMAHNVSSVKFTVIEPNGISLIDRIYQAVQDASPKDGAGSVNYSAAQYLMVIRFYGYDENGKVITGGSGADPQSGLTDPNAVIEKFIPFSIRSIEFSVSNRLVSYEFDCVPQGQIQAGGTRRGTVPYDMQLSDGTVGGILSGATVVTSDTSSTTPAPASTTTQDPANQTAAVQQRTGVTLNSQGRTNDPRAARFAGPQTSAPQTAAPPPKADAAPSPKKSIKNGLAGALTEFNQDLTKGGRPIYEQADEYEIVFAKGAEAIRDAKLVLPGKKKEASQSGMNAPPTADAKSASNKTGGKDTTVKSMSIVAGQPVVQVIDTIIRNSSYITDQALTKIDPVTDEEIGNSNVKEQPVQWYNISFEAIPKTPYDKLRNDYAYKIRYIISSYIIDKYDSKYFPIGSFRGVHKSYRYWFTGENTAIIDYNEKILTAYTKLVSGSNPSDSQVEIQRRNVLSTMREQQTYTYSPRSEQSSQGSRTKGNEVSANLADSLYHTDDLAKASVKIVGDPAWIQQGSLSGSVSVEEFDVNSFLPDGTINFDAEQIFFEINYNRPQDYNLETGLTDAAGDPINKKLNQNISRVYQAVNVTSEFRGGKFEQTIEGSLHVVPKPDGSNKAPTAPMPPKTVQREPPAAPPKTSQPLPSTQEARQNREAAEATSAAAIKRARATDSKEDRLAAFKAARAAEQARANEISANSRAGRVGTAPAARNPVGASSNGQNVSTPSPGAGGPQVSNPQKIAQD